MANMKNKKNISVSAPEKSTQKKDTSGRVQIIVEHVFGEMDILELYSDYVSDKMKRQNAALSDRYTV